MREEGNGFPPEVGVETKDGRLRRKLQNDEEMVGEEMVKRRRESVKKRGDSDEGETDVTSFFAWVPWFFIETMCFG